MDASDRKIIEILNTNGRITMKELASELKLSAPAVAERVKRLEMSGVITGYKAVIDRAKLGHAITVFINLDIPASRYGEFVGFADESPEISEFYYVTGQHSLIVKAFVDSTEHLANLLERTQIFGATETFVVMYSRIKDTI
ncbi:MAG: Lrp/AsnC family transcriptional regulator [Eubacteriaceae bacterium]|nr:Lrp/AsnC family transcriptional regulator [Eubacteriaceae bacterium]